MPDDELGFTIRSPSAVWDFVTPSEIMVSRRADDELVYVQICASCRWDVEHGLQVVYRRGETLSRVSAQDGHLTTSDARNLPDSEDSILYEG